MKRYLELEAVLAALARVRLKDPALEWRAACDEAMDEIRALPSWEEVIG